MTPLKVSFVKDGTNCRITVVGVGEVTIKESLGTKYLHFLILHVNESFNPIRLKNIICNGFDINDIGRDSSAAGLSNICQVEQRISFIPATDFKTIVQVRKEIKKLNIQLFEAETNNDLVRKEEIYEELNSLNKYLSQTVNISGVIKNISQQKRNDYYSIKRSLDKMIQLIQENSQPLADYIEQAVCINSCSITISIDFD